MIHCRVLPPSALGVWSDPLLALLSQRWPDASLGTGTEQVCTEAHEETQDRVVLLLEGITLTVPSSSFSAPHSRVGGALVGHAYLAGDGEVSFVCIDKNQR